MSQIEVIPLSPLDGSSGFAFSVQRDGHPSILLDAGQGKQAPEWLAQGAAHDIVWVSHGHHDHAGALPELLQLRPQLDVVLPAKAAPLARSIAIAGGRDAARAHAIFDNARVVKFHEPFEIAGVRAVCGPSGHGAGAGLLRIEFEDFAIGYTGDWALHPRSGSEPAALDLLRDLDLLICECALVGAKRLDDWSQMQTISDLFHFFDHAGPRLAVVSAFGEMHEVVSLLRNRDDVLVESGLSPFVDNVKFGDMSACSEHLNNGGLVVAHGPAMHAGDPSGRLALPHVTGPKARIALFNAVPRGTPAATLLSTRRRDRRTIYGETRRLRAHVQRFDFPSHATRPDLIRALNQLAPRAIFPFHQSPAALGDFCRALIRRGFDGDILPV